MNSNAQCYSGEGWVAVPGYEGLYAVSDRGRVMSFHTSQGRILSTPVDGSGYPHVNIADRNHQHKSFCVHSLVANSFMGPRPDGKEPNHKDGIKTNNRLDNLEWVTRSDNFLHAYRSGLVVNAVRGERCGRVKLNDAMVREIRSLYASGEMNRRQIAMKFGVYWNTIDNVIRRKNWSHVKDV